MKLFLFILLLILLSYTSTSEISHSESNVGKAVFESAPTEIFDGPWINLIGAGCENGSNKVNASVFALTHSQILQISNFGFSIPENSIIISILVSFNVQTNQYGFLSNFRESDIGLIKNKSGLKEYNTLVANESQSPPWDKTNRTITYPLPGEDELWGTNWIYADINSNDFGVFIRAQSGSTDTVAIVNCVNISITYNLDTTHISPSTNKPLLKMPYIFAISLGGGLLICIAFIILICIYISIKRGKSKILRQQRRELISDLDFQLVERENNLQLPEISPTFNSYLKNITLLKVIGIGKYGEVWWATYKSVDTKVACKCSRDEKESSSESTQLKKEIAIHKTIHHPNIIQFLGTFISQRKHCLTDQEFLVMEYAENGSAKTYLKNNPHIGWDFILTICIQISGAMNYLHGESILHRDIAGRNILLKSDLTAKLCDFGMARRLDSNQISFEDPSDSEIPILWSSPETIKKREYSKMTDVWSFGVTMWELFMYGKNPWNTLSVPIAMDNIINGITLELKSSAVPEMDPLLASIFEFLPLKRIDFNGINVNLYEIQDKYFKDKTRQSLYNDESDEEIKYNNLLLDKYF